MKRERKWRNLTVLRKKGCLFSQKLGGMRHHPYFPAKFARVAKCKVKRSLVWTVETKTAMTCFSLLLERQLKEQSVRACLAKLSVWKPTLGHNGIHWLVYVVVPFYPWFKFSFLLFLSMVRSRMVMYDNNIIMSLKQKKRKFQPRIKLNHNIYIDGARGMGWGAENKRLLCKDYLL